MPRCGLLADGDGCGGGCLLQCLAESGCFDGIACLVVLSQGFLPQDGVVQSVTTLQARQVVIFVNALFPSVTHRAQSLNLTGCGLLGGAGMVCGMHGCEVDDGST